MLTNVKEFLAPDSPDEAIRLVAEKGAGALLVAGGTTAAMSHNSQVRCVIDLGRMGCDRIEEQADRWVLGCNVRLNRLASEPGLSKLWNGMLCEAARHVGSQAIRNQVSLGGNLVQLFRWSDPPVALLAMGATLVLRGPEGGRRLAADEFFARHPRQVLKPAELLLAVEIQKPSGVHGGAFCKLAQTSFDLAIVDAAACLAFEGERIRSARVVVGGTRTVPWRARNTEEALQGNLPDESTLQKAGSAATEGMDVGADTRFSASYRRQMVQVMVRRALTKAVAGGSGQQARS